MTNLRVVRMKPSFRSCGNILGEKWDKTLSIACIRETPSSVGLGSWVKAKNRSWAKSMCVEGVCEVLGQRLFYSAFLHPGLQVRSGKI